MLTCRKVEPSKVVLIALLKQFCKKPFWTNSQPLESVRRGINPLPTNIVVENLSVETVCWNGVS